MQGPEVAFVDNVVSARNILMHALKTLRAVLNDLFHVEKRMTDAIADSCSLKGILCGEASNSELMLSCPSWKICNVGYVENDSRVHLAGQMCKTLARVFLPLLQSEIDRICEEEMEKQKCSREHVMSYPLAWFIKRADKTVPSPEVSSALGTLLVVTVGKGSSHRILSSTLHWLYVQALALGLLDWWAYWSKRVCPITHQPCVDAKLSHAVANQLKIICNGWVSGMSPD